MNYQSNLEINRLYLGSPQGETEYRCLGLIQGQYIPEPDHAYRGYLLTIDNLEIPANIINHSLLHYLETNVKELEKIQYWTVFVKNYPTLKVQIKHLKNKFDGNPPDQDYVSIRGVVDHINDVKQKFSIQIQRNKQLTPSERKESRNKPFSLTIYGELPHNNHQPSTDQFWDIIARREGDRLVLVEAEFITNQKAYRKTFSPRSSSSRSSRSYTPEKSSSNNYMPRTPRPVSPKSRDFRNKK